MENLASRTAKLPKVEIIVPQASCGRSTVESIQSGLFYSHVGSIKEISSRMTKECFADEKPLVIGTGGFARFFENENVFDVIASDLILQGILMAIEMNTEKSL